MNYEHHFLNGKMIIIIEKCTSKLNMTDCFSFPKINDLTHSLDSLTDASSVRGISTQIDAYSGMINAHLLTIYAFEAAEWVAYVDQANKCS